MPVPVALPTMDGVPPMPLAQFTCLKCGVARLHSLHVLGVELQVEESRIVQPNGQPAPASAGLIIP